MKPNYYPSFFSLHAIAKNEGLIKFFFFLRFSYEKTKQIYNHLIGSQISVIISVYKCANDLVLRKMASCVHPIKNLMFTLPFCLFLAPCIPFQWGSFYYYYNQCQWNVIERANGFVVCIVYCGDFFWIYHPTPHPFSLASLFVSVLFSPPFFKIQWTGR